MHSHVSSTASDNDPALSAVVQSNWATSHHFHYPEHVFSRSSRVASTHLGSSNTKSFAVIDSRKQSLVCTEMCAAVRSARLTKQWPNGLLGKKQFIKKTAENKRRTQQTKTRAAPTLRADYPSCERLICPALWRCGCRNCRFNVHILTKGFLKNLSKAK